MPRPALMRYGVAAATVGLVLLVRTPLEGLVGTGPPLILFIPALTFSAWFGGFGAGMLTTALSVLACNYFFFPPISSFWIESGYDRFQLGVFLLEGSLTSVLMKQLRDAQSLSESNATAAEAYRDTLQQSQARLQAILDHSTSIIYLKDSEGRYLITNRQWETTFDISRRLAVGQTDLDLFPQTMAEAFRTQDRAVQQSAKAMEWEDQMTGSAGARTYLTVKFPLLDGNGTPYAVGGFSTDISDRKHAEEALRRERDFAESLIAAAQAIVLVLDHRGRVLQFNPFLVDLSGRRPDDVLGSDWFATFVPPEDRPRASAAFYRALADPEGGRDIHRMFTASDHIREVEWFHKRLPGDPRGVLTIGHDITDLRKAQQRALQAERLAAIGQMVAGLAHESRNALQRSQACLEMLVRRVANQPDALDLLTGIQEAQDDLHRLYEEVRNYAAPIILDRRECLLRDLLQEAWVRLEPLRKGREARLREHGVEAPSCAVDRFRIGQVFRNVLDNALAACQDPVEVDVEWTETYLNGKSAVCVAVVDNGPGLTPAQRRNLFEPFFTTKTQGTGLGMAIAKRIVEAHEGTIEIGYGYGPGGRIVITLPTGNL